MLRFRGKRAEDEIYVEVSESTNVNANSNTNTNLGVDVADSRSLDHKLIKLLYCCDTH